MATDIPSRFDPDAPAHTCPLCGGTHHQDDHPERLADRVDLADGEQVVDDCEALIRRAAKLLARLVDQGVIPPGEDLAEAGEVLNAAEALLGFDEDLTAAVEAVVDELRGIGYEAEGA